MNGVLNDPGKPGGILRLQWFFRCSIAACAFIDAWIARFQMGPDGISYLDMGDMYMKGDWHNALNSYWSPLYSWLIGLMISLTKPTMRWEFLEVHLINAVIFLVVLFCFEAFWRQLLASIGDQIGIASSPFYAWVLGYSLFFCVHFSAGAIEMVHPDVLVAGVVYLASAMMLRFAKGQMGIASAAWFGVLLGVGYLAKAAMVPFAFFTMATMCVVAFRRHQKKSLIAVTLLGFLLIALPYAAALSLNLHRFTMGDSAKLNQGWFVNGVLRRQWAGDQPGNTGAAHPLRKILESPEIYEFATPIAGTYPVWYDATYWYTGLDSKIHLGNEIRAFAKNSIVIANFLLKSDGVLLTAMLMFFLLSDRTNGYWRQATRFWPIMVPAVAIVFMYSLVYWEERFISGQLVVGFGALMGSMSISNQEFRVRVLRTTSLVLCALAITLAVREMRDDQQLSRVDGEMVVVAQRLQASGIQPGDHVAVIGDGYIEEYWARLAKVQIIAERPRYLEVGLEANSFWSLSPQDESAALASLKSAGAKAAVTDSVPATLPPGWIPLGNTGRAVYFLR
jgi:hypothetical protein